MTDKPKNLWQRLMTSKTFMWVTNIIVFISCTTEAIIVEPRWIALIDAGIAGFALSSMAFTGIFIYYRNVVAELRENFNEMAAMNSTLIHGKFKMMVSSFEPPDDDDAPIVPKNNLN